MPILRLIAFLVFSSVAFLLRKQPALDHNKQCQEAAARPDNERPHSGYGYPNRTDIPPAAGDKGIEGREYRLTQQDHWLKEERNWSRQTGLGVATAIAAIVASGAAIFALQASRQAVKEAHVQAETAQAAFVAQERPWIMLADVKPASLDSDDKGGVMFWVNISVKNIGHSPAQDVWVSGKLVIDQFDPLPEQAMKSVCQESKTYGFPGNPVFPDQTQPVQEPPNSFYIPAQHVWAARDARIESAYLWHSPRRAQAWAEELSKFPFYAALHLVGCINYRSPDRRDVYQTSFAFEIGSFPLLSGESINDMPRPLAQMIQRSWLFTRGNCNGLCLETKSRSAFRFTEPSSDSGKRNASSVDRRKLLTRVSRVTRFTEPCVL
ncbi:MAG: hypothetical protein J0H14_13675 [Alphaproteobacteria bacterium]|nr:hypothetical protein [Alphaproteobacteria bacterium]